MSRSGHQHLDFSSTKQIQNPFSPNHLINHPLRTMQLRTRSTLAEVQPSTSSARRIPRATPSTLGKRRQSVISLAGQDGSINKANQTDEFGRRLTSHTPSCEDVENRDPNKQSPVISVQVYDADPMSPSSKALARKVARSSQRVSDVHNAHASTANGGAGSARTRPAAATGIPLPGSLTRMRSQPSISAARRSSVLPGALPRTTTTRTSLAEQTQQPLAVSPLKSNLSPQKAAQGQAEQHNQSPVAAFGSLPSKMGRFSFTAEVGASAQKPLRVWEPEAINPVQRRSRLDTGPPNTLKGRYASKTPADSSTLPSRPPSRIDQQGGQTPKGTTVIASTGSAAKTTTPQYPPPASLLPRANSVRKAQALSAQSTTPQGEPKPNVSSEITPPSPLVSLRHPTIRALQQSDHVASHGSASRLVQRIPRPTVTLSTPAARERGMKRLSGLMQFNTRDDRKIELKREHLLVVKADDDLQAKAAKTETDSARELKSLAIRTDQIEQRDPIDSTSQPEPVSVADLETLADLELGNDDDETEDMLMADVGLLEEIKSSTADQTTEGGRVLGRSKSLQRLQSKTSIARIDQKADRGGDVETTMLLRAQLAAMKAELDEQRRRDAARIAELEEQSQAEVSKKEAARGEATFVNLQVEHQRLVLEHQASLASLEKQRRQAHHEVQSLTHSLGQQRWATTIHSWQHLGRGAQREREVLFNQQEICKAWLRELDLWEQVAKSSKS